MRASGESLLASVRNAIQREARALRGLERLLTAPLRGARHDDLLPGLRHLTFDGVVYWFIADQALQQFTLIALFTETEDHITHMSARFPAP